MLKSRSKVRGFLLMSALAALLTVTVSPTAKATAVGFSFRIVAIGLSMNSTTLAYVKFSNFLTGHNCTIPFGTPGADRLFFDYTTTRGKAVMSLLTAAHLAGKSVSMQGDNVCLTQTVEPDNPPVMTESIKWLRVE